MTELTLNADLLDLVTDLTEQIELYCAANPEPDPRAMEIITRAIEIIDTLLE